MNTRTTSKSALFLMELILAIFFFSLASAVCIQLFVKAHILGNDTTNKSRSVVWAQNIAECYLGNDGDTDATVATLDAVSDGVDSFSLYFNEEWNKVTAQEATYVAKVTTGEDGQMRSADIVIQRLEVDANADTATADVNSGSSADVGSDNTVIYELPVKLHVPLAAD